MNPRLTTLAMIVGGFVGGLIPALWGAGGFSFSGLVFSSLGAAAGVWLAFNASR